MTESHRRQQEIVDEFAFLDDWMLRFQQVIEHGDAMAPMDEADKTDDRLVRGCQSRVWLDARSMAAYIFSCLAAQPARVHHCHTPRWSMS